MAKLNAGGSALGYSGYLGGGGTDAVNGIGVDASGNAFATGATASTNFPTTSGAFKTSSGGTNDAFLVQVNSAGSTLSYASYYGGSGDDQGNALTVDPAGNAYIAGQTSSTNLPTQAPVQSTNAGGYDAFVAKWLPSLGPPIFTGITTDTGASSSDQITSSRNLHILGTGAANGTVTLYREGVGQIGQAAVNGSGSWNFDYSGTTLAEGVAAFRATEALGGVTSAFTQDFLATVDLTGPKVTLNVAASTASRAPQVRVNASDLNGLPNGTTVTLDVDTNNDGNFTDAGETGYAAGTLTDGWVNITLPTLSGQGTYTLQGRVTDLAGNQGTSATVSLQVVAGSPWSVTGQALSQLDPSGDAVSQLGNAMLSQPIDLTQSGGGGLGAPPAPALVYNADSVTEKPAIQLAIPTDNTQSLPSTITVQLTFNGTTGALTTYTTTGFSPGDTLYALQQPSSAITSTGRFPWSATVTMNYGTPIVRTVTGVAYAVTQDSSPFGAGWTFGPTDQLFSIAADGNGPAGMLRVYGTGGERFYQDLGGSYQSSASDGGTLSKSGTTYTYQTPDGQTTVFNSGGYETSWTSADSQASWQYRYNGSNQLTGTTAPDGALATITYSGTTVTLQTVNSRTTTLVLASSNLTKITNPDGGVHTFAYDSLHHVTGETFGLLQNSWAYTSGGTVGTITQGSGSSPQVMKVSAIGAQGLSAFVAGAVWGTVTDPNSHKTSEQLDANGRVTQKLNADGGLWQFSYGNGFVTSQTDPLGLITTFARDTQGYVTLETLPDSNTQQSQYQTNFHALTTYTDERSKTSTYAYLCSRQPQNRRNLQDSQTFLALAA